MRRARRRGQSRPSGADTQSIPDEFPQSGSFRLGRRKGLVGAIARRLDPFLVAIDPVQVDEHVVPGRFGASHRTQAGHPRVAEGVPGEWGDIEKRGITWEIVTATALLESGADILVLRHPKTISAIRSTINQLMAH